MYKLDISRAYRHLHSDPLNWPLMCQQWPVKTWYVDTAIALGLHTGAVACQCTTNVLACIMQWQAFDLVNYIDDLAGCEVGRKVNEAFSCLQTLLKELGLPEAPHKTLWPHTKMVFLGILFDSVAFTMSIPKAKLDDTLMELRWWISKCCASCSELQSVLDRLHHISKCARPRVCSLGACWPPCVSLRR